MKNILKKLILFSILCICFCSTVYAKEGIEYINIDVYIDKNGDADITETWKCEAYSGTEWYHPYYDIGNAKIIDLKVSEDDKKYELVSSWNPTWSQSMKKEKCGLNKVSNGIEICWGMGDYGVHEYEVNYTIENFVDTLNDSQMIYWTLIPYDRSDAVEEAIIKISAYKDFDEDTPVWGFGNKNGVCKISDGSVVMSTNDELSKSEYMTVLVKLPAEFFDTINEVNRDFEYFYEQAMEGSEKPEADADYMAVKMVTFFIVFFIFALAIRSFFNLVLSVIFKGFEKLAKKSPIGIVFFIIAFYVGVCTDYFLWILFVLFVIGVIANKVIIEGKVIKGKIKESQVDYYRDIPCNKDLFEAYYIAYQYRVLKNETDLLGAVILKWIKEKKATVVDKNQDSKNDCIQLYPEFVMSQWDNACEKELYEMMYEASGDGLLEKKELKKWSSNKYSKLFSWFKKVLTSEQNKLIARGDLIKETEKKNSKYIASDNLYNEGKNICALKKYLKDYTLIHDREAIEVALFEEYLIMAQMLGIAKKVIKQFKDLYPNVIEESNLNYNDYMFVRTISYRSINRAMSARTAANMASGGGGRSHGGGGGGSRGGGGGGGGRR